MSEVWIAEAPKGDWRVQDAERGWQAGLFHSASTFPVLLPTDSQTYWLRFSLRNPTARAHSYILAARGLYDDFLQLHFSNPAAPANWLTLQTGENVRFPEKSVPIREPVFEFSLGPGEERLFYLEMNGLISVQTAFRILSPSSRFWVERRMADRMTGLHLGVTGALFLYNLFVFFTFRRKDFFWYLCYVGTFWIGFFIYQNLHLEFLPWLISHWHSYVTVLSMILAGYFLTLFVQDFLTPKDFAPRLGVSVDILKRIWLGLLASLLVPVSLLLTMGMEHPWIHDLGNVIFSATALLVLVVSIALPPFGIHLWRRGCRQARFFGLAFFFYFAGLMPGLFAQLGLRLRSVEDLYWMQAGTMAEMLLLAFALADKVALIERERTAAQMAAMRETTERVKLEVTNEEILRQKARIEEQAQRIQMANVQLELSNQALKHLNQEKSEFLGIAAHDLKNPLSAICALSKMLRDAQSDPREALNPEEKHDILSNIIDSSEQMLTTIDALLSTDRIESGKVRIEPQICHLGDIMGSVVRLNSSHAQHKGINLELGSLEGLAGIADPQSLREIFDNLVSNAIKYTPPGGSVHVHGQKLASRPESVRMSIRDSGPGFSEEDREHLYQRFSKLSARPTGGENSTGLGLSIVHKLCQLNEIKITLESRKGFGATFHLDILAWRGHEVNGVG
jgi:two-component system, sensor histidine kinase LadS